MQSAALEHEEASHPQRWLEGVRHILYGEPSHSAWEELVNAMKNAPDSALFEMGLAYAGACLDGWPMELREAKLEWVESLVSRKPDPLMALASSCTFTRAVPRSIVSVFRKDIGLENIRALCLTAPHDKLSVYVRRMMTAPLMKRIESLRVEMSYDARGNLSPQQGTILSADFSSLRTLELRGRSLTQEGLDALCSNEALYDVTSLHIHLDALKNDTFQVLLGHFATLCLQNLSIQWSPQLVVCRDVFLSCFTWAGSLETLRFECTYADAMRGDCLLDAYVLDALDTMTTLKSLMFGPFVHLRFETLRKVVLALEDTSSCLERSNVLENAFVEDLSALLEDTGISEHALHRAFVGAHSDRILMLLEWRRFNACSPRAQRILISAALESCVLRVALRAISCMCGEGVWSRTYEDILLGLWDDPRPRVRRKAQRIFLSSCLVKGRFAHAQSQSLGVSGARRRLERIGWDRVVGALHHEDDAVVRFAIALLDAYLPEVPHEVLERALYVMEGSSPGFIARKYRRFSKRLACAPSKIP